MASHYTLTIRVESLDSIKDPTSSASDTPLKNESGDDAGIYAARKRATKILDKAKSTFTKDKEGAGKTAEDKGVAKKQSSDMKGIATTLISIAAVGYQFQETLGKTRVANSGNSALINGRENQRTHRRDSLGAGSAIIGAAMYGGPVGAISAIVGILGSRMIDMQEDINNLNWQMQIARDNARKTSERLGFDATKRNRYTYNY